MFTVGTIESGFVEEDSFRLIKIKLIKTFKIKIDPRISGESENYISPTTKT